MIARRQMIGVLATISDWLGEGPERFWEAARRCMAKWLAEAIDVLDQIYNYRILYLGGGNAKRIDFDLPPNVKIVPNVAGLLGGIALWRQ